MKKKIIIAVALALAVLVASTLVWFFYRYEAGILSLTYKATPVVSSPLAAVNYTWEGKAYSARIFGNAPFDGKGYVHRERITSENRFANYPEVQRPNVSVRLQFVITNEAGFVICNETLQIRDGNDREFTFEFMPESVKAGNTLRISVSLSLTVSYEYGTGGEHKEFRLQKEWTRTIQVRQEEPRTGTVF